MKGIGQHLFQQLGLRVIEQALSQRRDDPPHTHFFLICRDARVNW